MAFGDYYGFAPYVSVAERRKRAARKLAQLRKKGHEPKPVQIDGRAIATTFWGKAWCDHLESHADFANRLPRGRTYARNGSVIDLQIVESEVRALVSGSEFYDVKVRIAPLAAAREHLAEIFGIEMEAPAPAAAANAAKRPRRAANQPARRRSRATAGRGVAKRTSSAGRARAAR